LLICAFNTARICRVSTQITGKPASARPLKSHCDSGPRLPSNPFEVAGGVRQHCLSLLKTLNAEKLKDFFGFRSFE